MRKQRLITALQVRWTSEIIGDNLKKAGWTWGCVSAVDANGRTIWIADAHRGDGKRFIACGREADCGLWNSNLRYALGANYLDKLT